MHRNKLGEFLDSIVSTKQRIDAVITELKVFKCLEHNIFAIFQFLE